jgi:WD40 repeat protein
MWHCIGVAEKRNNKIHWTADCLQIVGEWNGRPGTVPSPRLPAYASVLHPHQAQRLQRMQLVNPGPSACVAQALMPHPRHGTVLSGSAPGYVHCWSFLDQTLKATYAPLPMTRSLLSSVGGGASVPHPQQVAHWGYVTDIAINTGGSRFAAVGKGGWVCLWRFDAVWADTIHGRVGCCDWAHRCLDKQGDAITFVGGKSSLLLVGGHTSGLQDLSVWDILMPLPRACVAAAPCAQSVNDVVLAADQVTALVVMRRGAVAAFDLRKLGPARVDTGGDLMRRERQQGLLWVRERAHEGAATCAAVCPPGLRPTGYSVDLGATGGRDGSVILWDVKTGVELQLLSALHWTRGRSLFGFGATEKVGCKVKSLAFSESGLISASQSTTVLHTPWH